MRRRCVFTKRYGRVGLKKDVVDQMQTREQLYDVLNYYSFQDKLDQLFTKKSESLN